MARCGSVCDASETLVSWSAVPGFARLFSEGTIVDVEIEHDDLNLKYSSDGTEVSRTGKQATMATVTITELPCSSWWRSIWNAWLADKFECGTLVVNDCCGIFILDFATVEPDWKDSEIDANNPVNVTFRGLLNRGSTV